MVIYESATEQTAISVTLTKENIDTVEKMLRYSVNKYRHKDALGTRQILAEENEVQTNGRIFKKVLSVTTYFKMQSANIILFY